MGYAVLFPGQGSQFVGMADPWAEHPAGQAVLEEASTALGRSIVEGCRDEDALATTAFVQPALLACDVAAFRVLQAEGLTDVVGVAGHSLGEFAALVAADAVALSDALELVLIRGAAMQQAGEERPGAMTALLGVGADEAEALCAEVRGGDELVVANRNSPAQSVVSGSIPAIERLEAAAKERKTRAVRLPVAGAFHSELMRPAVQPVLDVLGRIEMRDPVIPDRRERHRRARHRGGATPRAGGPAGGLARATGRPASATSTAAGATAFLEAGPGEVLTKLMKRIDPAPTAIAISDPEAARSGLNA